MALDETIFRKSALERLKNPERLDHLMQVTSLRGWIVIAALSVVVASGALWGIWGTVTDEVDVVGIMLRRGGIFEIQSEGAGQVDSILVRPGQLVAVDEVVAYIAQPQQLLTVRNIEGQLARMRSQRDSLATRLETSVRIDLDANAREEEKAQANFASASARVTYLLRRLQADSVAFRDSLITPDVVQGTIAQLRTAEDAQVTADVNLRTLQGRAITTLTSAADQVRAADEQILETEAQLTAAQALYTQSREVVSTFAGMILEELVDVGETVNAGRSLFAMELSGQSLDMYLFTPDATLVVPDMLVRVIPNGLKPEEVGYMLGTVETVSDAPMSAPAMNRYLRNDALVQSFAGTTGVYLIDVRPTQGDTPSGFEWTSREGPNTQLGSGTLLTGHILVARHRPITMVIPALKRWLAGSES